jgi:hypothetical protein
MHRCSSLQHSKLEIFCRDVANHIAGSKRNLLISIFVQLQQSIYWHYGPFNKVCRPIRIFPSLKNLSPHNNKHQPLNQLCSRIPIFFYLIIEKNFLHHKCTVLIDFWKQKREFKFEKYLSSKVYCVFNSLSKRST